MTAPIITPELLATIAQFLQTQGSAPAPVAAPAPVVEKAPKKLEVICKKTPKGVSMEDISVVRQPTAEEFSKVGQYSRMFAKACMAGKPLEEGIIRINKNGAITVLVDVDYVTAGKIRLIVKTAPDVRLKAWRSYSESAKNVRSITLGGLAQAIKTYTAEPGAAAPVTFKAKVEALMREPISDSEKIKKISKMLEDGRKTETAEVAPEPVAEEKPAPKKRKTAAK